MYLCMVFSGIYFHFLVIYIYIYNFRLLTSSDSFQSCLKNIVLKSIA